MFTLSAFADEISPDFTQQLDVLESEGIRHIELRGAWNKNVLEFNDDELLYIRNSLHSRGFAISAIGSPIGKISITDDFIPHLAAFDRALHCAAFFETSFIRIFSFFMPEDTHAYYRDEVLHRIHSLTLRAKEAGVVLLHENEKGIYGDTPEHCLDLFTACSSPHLKCTFDPANFVQCGVMPFTEAFSSLEPYIQYIHIKDARWDTRREVPAGEGDAELVSLLQHLQNNEYEGFLSLEPHLAESGTFAGYTGPQLFRTAAQALKRILSDIRE